MSADTVAVIRVGAHVRVVGVQHPHAGKTGVISELLSLYGPVRAVIALDDKSGYIVVTLPHLEVIA